MHGFVFGLTLGISEISIYQIVKDCGHYLATIEQAIDPVIIVAGDDEVVSVNHVLIMGISVVKHTNVKALEEGEAMVEVIAIANYRKGYALGGSIKVHRIGIGINLFKGQPDTIHRVELIGADINFHGMFNSVGI